ncbi:MAG TPA: hypothetical protein VG737_16840, partial [Cyclobacteriaceae bacterium]|nr:hypothetical protein [Cyclobacteriaceae bacterium]
LEMLASKKGYYPRQQLKLAKREYLKVSRKMLMDGTHICKQSLRILARVLFLLYGKDELLLIPIKYQLKGD